ncbi:MAG: 50S ribosomal protein L3 [Planctomycetaceae bacterium]|nr:MAG: 50S ribosomal protein L3 [Planctomycetaceae bacterium]
MAILLGKKVGMTQVYNELGKLVPVSVIQAGPCIVMQVKSAETDGYNAIQLGFDEVKPVRRKQPEIGHARKANAEPKKFIKEMRLAGDSEQEYKAGESVTVAVFSEDKSVDVVGTSKGKGFAGVMKRHGFGGFPASHGTERKHRAPGSIASFASDAGHGPGPKRGKKMAGHMGHCRITTKNHDLVEIDEEKNLLIVKGSIPGPAGGYCIIRSAKK